MSKQKVKHPREDLSAAARLAHDLGDLDDMTLGELAEKYREVFGEPTRSHNKEHLRKRIAWRIQELAEGGLSPRALERIAVLAPQAPVRWKQPADAERQASVAKPARPGPVHDKRLPPVGTVLTRIYDGVEHKVTILAKGFEYLGAPHRSLSKIAQLITGKSWNGYVFFLGRGAANGIDGRETHAP